jgi:hypothetical protein
MLQSNNFSTPLEWPGVAWRRIYIYIYIYIYDIYAARRPPGGLLIRSLWNAHNLSVTIVHAGINSMQ